jgi:hypothetical protein
MKPETASHDHATLSRPARVTLAHGLRGVLLVAAAIFFALHFLHLKADFPNHSPWDDWSKYTDEGWYGDAAIRHYLSGHWYFKGDFNPAVALPLWPAIEWIVFRFTGVSAVAARALTLCVFAISLVGFYRLIERHTRARNADSGPSLAAPLAVALLCASPFFYVFERMAILEPLLIALMALALLTASHLHPLTLREGPWKLLRCVLTSIALGLILPAMVLTKTTAIFLMPAIGYMVWARAGYRWRAALRLAMVPAIMAAAIWLAYLLLLVRPHYLDDYRYLFSANGYTGIELEPLSKVILNTIGDGMWMGKILFPMFFAVLAMGVFWKPRFFNNPLVPALLLWTGGYFAFLAYHNNLQPRYYLVAAAPITILIALAIDFFRQADNAGSRVASATIAAVAALAILIPDAVMQMDFVLHPDYTFEAAADGVKRVVLADPTHSHLILSISGSDLTLMTGLPSIDDDFGTMDLDKRVAAYRPGWYAAWNELDDDKMDALTPLYRVERVAAFPAMDDPDRNLLILYRLDPTVQTPEVRKHKPVTPKPLRTRIGQQPSVEQLEH